MAKILVLGGAGAMASGTVRDLVAPYSSPAIGLITVADFAAERANKLVAELGDQRLRGVQLNVEDSGKLAALLQEHDLCINAVPTFAGHQMAIFEACLQARRTYVDYGGMGVFTVQQKKQHDAWKAAGVTAVLGLGADPGVSNMICKAVAERLDTIDRINLYWAATLVGEENPVLVPPYSVSTILGEYANPSMQFLDGSLKEVAPQSGKETLLLPEPWGRTEFMYTQHSEPLTVPFAEGIREKGIREFTWKLHLPHREHEAWTGLIKAGFGAFDQPIKIGNANITPAAFLEAVIARNIATNRHRIPAQQSHEIHLAIGHGTRKGKKTILNFAVIGHPHPSFDSYVDAGTSMGLSIGVQLLLSKERKAGVWGPEEYYDVSSFLAELQRRHFEVHENIDVKPAA
jgi:saccharopine dehydrogenase-like NADP-dependent oxidoreductase